MASAYARSRAAFSSPVAKDTIKVLCWAPVALFVVRHGYSCAGITGGSMQPLLNTDMRSNPSHSDVVLLERWAVALGLIKRGDVVTFWNPSDPNRLAAKRVVGLAGDIVRPRKPELSEPIRVPAGSVWVEGDSAATSVDSNTMGPIPLGLLDARVGFIIWPLNRWARIANDTARAEGRVKRKSDVENVFHD